MFLMVNSAIWPLLYTIVLVVAQNQTYDYVIVGGGLSGLVVANRLSEDSERSVLVIENGQIDNTALSSIPYLSSNLNLASMYPNLVSAPDPILGNLSFPVRVGNVLGGGSVVNGMMFDRGSNADYDAWEELGNEGWGWKGLEPYFMKATNFTPPSETTQREFNITFDKTAYGNGPVQVSIPSFQYPDYAAIMQSWHEEEGVPVQREGFATPVGAYWSPNTIDSSKGVRSQAKNAYYDPAQSRPNLKLLIETHVDEIIFDTKDGKPVAKGVKISSRNNFTSLEVYAAKEVILAAGGIFTPHLLMVSGIGPAAMLNASKVPVKLDHPAVGSNFQDHVAAYVAFNISNLSFPNVNTIPTNASFNSSAESQYENNRTGPWSVGRGNALAMLPLKQFSSKFEEIAAEAEKQDPADFLPDRYTKFKGLYTGYIKQRDMLLKRYRNEDAAVGELPIQPSGRATAALQKPLSRGTITLNTTYPHSYPIVTYNSLANPVDLAILSELIRFNRRHWKSPALSQFQPIEVAPGAQYQTDDEILAGLLETNSIQPSFAHPSGGCSMMPEELGGCVSDELLVHGVDKLSVVDASILPMIPACHLQATMYAVAEKAADVIKGRNH